MTSITGRLADFVAGTTYQGLPDGVAARAKLLIMDALGVAVRARHEAGSTPSLLAAVDKLGLGRGSASVIGDEAGYAPPAAALINGNPFMLKSSRQRGVTAAVTACSAEDRCGAPKSRTLDRSAGSRTP